LAFATFSFGGYGLALAALALVVFGAIECPPCKTNKNNILALKRRKIFIKSSNLKRSVTHIKKTNIFVEETKKYNFKLFIVKDELAQKYSNSDTSLGKFRTISFPEFDIQLLSSANLSRQQRRSICRGVVVG